MNNFRKFEKIAIRWIVLFTFRATGPWIHHQFEPNMLFVGIWGSAFGILLNRVIDFEKRTEKLGETAKQELGRYKHTKKNTHTKQTNTQKKHP